MQIIIEPVTTKDDEAAMLLTRQQVFEREMGLTVPRLTIRDNLDSFHLLARVGPDGDVVAALSVVDTSGDHGLHEGYGLKLPSQARVARYAQLAVLRRYRGLYLPLMLMLEAHRRCVVPNRFEYTWLLFDAERAASSLMRKWLAFAPGERTFASEYGLSRTLLRDESAPQSEQAIWRTEQYLGQMPRTFISTNQVVMHPDNSA
jgi:hypothetical protein